jgi:phage terminase large subunit
VQAYLKTPDGRYYFPNPVQVAFHASKARFRAVLCGVGLGKSVMSMVEVLRYALQHPGCQILVGRESYPELIDSTWKVLKGLIRANLPEDAYQITDSPQKMGATFWNGSEIVCRCLQDVESLQGPEWDAIAIDEATELPDEKIFNECRRRLRGKRAPNRMWLTGTPKGSDWCYTLFTQSDPRYELFTGSTHVNAANLNPDYLADLETLDPNEYARYVEGQFLSFQGRVFPSFDRAIHVVDPVPLPDHYPITLSIDYGYDPDPAHVLWAKSDCLGNVIVYRELVLSKHTEAQQAEAILAASGKEKWDKAFLDPYSNQKAGDALGKLNRLTLYRNAGITGLRLGNGNKDDGYSAIREYLRFDPQRLHPIFEGQQPGSRKKGSPRLVIFNTCPVLIRELEHHVYRNGKPEDKNDHGVSSLRFLLLGNPRRAALEVVKEQNPIWQWLQSRRHSPSPTLDTPFFRTLR